MNLLQRILQAGAFREFYKFGQIQ